MTIQVGLGIGRLVLRALNRVESVLAAAAVVLGAFGDAPARVIAWTVTPVVLLVGQLAAVRPPR
ncbi:MULTISPECIES: hypothetical protein [Streptomyces]|uniref:hypothetical protein n=1 Tax=Streptomyces TaxID=1883 RepID=UPI0001853AE9|nr:MULTISPECIES: hypothetical protein [Streptomyces]MYT10054.1 hypothetical protein [Streptomyces sp. SID5470]